MQPLLIPDAPALMAYGFLFAFAGMFALLLVAKLGELQRHVRFLLALLIVLVCVGGTVYASQPVTKYCATCASSVEPGSWAWYVFCWGC